MPNNLLTLFYDYTTSEKLSQEVLVDGWPVVLNLCRNCIAQMPTLSIGTATPSLHDVQLCRLSLTSFKLLACYIKMVQPTIDKKRQKETHDIAQKACEAAANIAGLILESVTWFGRHYAVNHGRHNVGTILYELTLDALVMISENTAYFLDTVFDSSEKERAVTVISAMMQTVWPYLRDRSEPNSAHFTAASKFLANLAGFAYNRRVWKKEAFDLVSAYDSQLFQIPMSSFTHWKVICDALMTFERQTFKDFIRKYSCLSTTVLS